MVNERAIDTWREKLEFLLAEEATASDAEQKFAIRKRIEKARQRIAELGAESPEPTGGGVANVVNNPSPPLPRTPGPLSTQRLAELTAHARQSIAAAAKTWLDEQCAPFVVPSLSRQKTERQDHGLMELRAEREPLTTEEIAALVQGRLLPDANRVRIVGDSGMGKTSLLHYCESQVATGDDGRLPLRVDGLSGYDWKHTQSELLKTIGQRVLHRYLPADVPDDERCVWFERLVESGKVVFLLDALDQTDDQLNQPGLRGFLQSAGVANCPVVITLRPEVEGSEVFRDARWDTLKVDDFDEDRQRKFLGPVAEILLPKDGEEWRDAESYLLKQQWAGLLGIPLLLAMLRDIARAAQRKETAIPLDQLRSRHALYRQAVGHLIEKGLDSTEPTRHRGVLEDPGEVIEFLAEIGWCTVCQGSGNFTAVLQGEAFSRLRRQRRDVLPALKQVHLITRHSVLDDFGQAGLAWRHRSFSEYFAGLQFVSVAPEQQKALLREHGRDPRWQWVFRFALCEANRRGAATQSVKDNLARDLICCGNPFLLFDAIDLDRVTVPDHLDRLCRWLVHRDWKWTDRDYRSAWQESGPPAVDDQWTEILESLFDRKYRDSRCLHAAWQLVQSCNDDWAVGIRRRFLDEFPQMLAKPSGEELGAAQSLVAEASFVRCPPDPAQDGKPFPMGSPKSDKEAFGDEQPRHKVHITPFHLQRSPVSNLQFELFDPSHRFRRDQYSPDDDTPAIWVSWYMADLFCTWLGRSYRLPTEAEWEYAARAGTKTPYWWGDTFDKGKCHNDESGLKHTLPPDESRANPWGLIDMLGNVWEWCLDGQRDYDETPQHDPVGPRDVASVRVIRGGSWAGVAWYCRAAYRGGDVPRYRNQYLGFRVAAVSLGAAGKQEQ